MKMEGTSRSHPAFHHIFPHSAWAKSQVSLFFRDIAVRYPKKLLISLGGCFSITRPKPAINRGISKLQRNMNIQNHIITAFHLKVRKISGNLGTALIAGTGIWTVSEIDYNPPVSCCHLSLRKMRHGRIWLYRTVVSCKKEIMTEGGDLKPV